MVVSAMEKTSAEMGIWCIRHIWSLHSLTVFRECLSGKVTSKQRLEDEEVDHART